MALTTTAALRGRPSFPLTHRGPVWTTAAVQGAALFLFAFGLRLAVGLLTASTFDPDEFVIVALGRNLAHGAIPYHSFMYFHPPGMLVLFAGTHVWWPIGRIVESAVDSLTAVAVWRLGCRVYMPGVAAVAGLLYAANPIALISSARIGPDPILTAFCIWGLVVLLSTPSRRGAIGAGLCLALAVWTKYPALIFVPIYVLAAPRRAYIMMVACAAGLIALFAPFAAESHAMWEQTVVWQLAHRTPTPVLNRIGSVAVYWLFLNPLALAGLRRWRQQPPWLTAGFCLGAVFLFTAEAYYHYFVPVLPFAALLAAPVVAPAVLRAPRAAAAAAVALALLWGADVARGPDPLRLFVTASSLPKAATTARALDRLTPPHARIMGDEFEYALLAHHKIGASYFWNMNHVVPARVLERRLFRLDAVVQTRGDNSFPPGFAGYLAARGFRRIRAANTVIWLVHGPHPASRPISPFGTARARAHSPALGRMQ